ncbi:40938_t:CDS:2 [Gigaspora margarita]|uniref:40938_t:CDS:1 n=1 Tax=Gigaspora margarita TaxID=4874 RepID=A0ABN7W6Q9_GIGMA|nr:40938_t:CDS:2 [Gigaspora margarita]
MATNLAYPALNEHSMSKPVSAELIDFTTTSMCSFFHMSQPQRQKSHQLPDLPAFITKIIHDLNLPVLNVVVCLIYVHRLKSQLPKNYETEYGTAHRVFISSILVASKYVDDVPITARKMLDSVGKDIWSIKDIIRMERAFLSFIQWDLSIDRSAFDSYLNELRENQIVL